MVDLQQARVTLPAQRAGLQVMSSLTPVIRPWGWYSVVGEPDERPIAAVKTIVVQPGHALSLQTHRRRAERWTPLTNGLGAVIGDEEVELLTGQVYDIGIGVRHRLLDLAGAGGVVLELMYGEYDESDIVRHADRYQRIGAEEKSQ